MLEYNKIMKGGNMKTLIILFTLMVATAVFAEVKSVPTVTKHDDNTKITLVIITEVSATKK